jgi:hypothetical protein
MRNNAELNKRRGKRTICDKMAYNESVYLRFAAVGNFGFHAARSFASLI